MKRFLDGKMRMLSLLLSLVLAVGLIQVNALTASAETTYSFSYAYDCQRSPAFPKKGQSFQAHGFKTPLDSSGTHIGGDINATYDWKLTSLGNYGSLTSPSSYLTSIVEKVATVYSTDQKTIEKDDIEVFLLTKDGVNVATGVIFAQSSELTVFLGDNWNASGSTYLLSNSKLDDPTTVTISRDVTTGFAPPAPATPQHNHEWTSEPSGLGTNQASAIISCKDLACGEGIKVSLTASNVTLPGDAFSAKIDVEELEVPAVYGLRSARLAPPQVPIGHGLTVSETPGYKYSPDGSNFTEIDPKTFTPAPGFYQASILVTDGNDTVENLYVTYTVSDPVVTAATGDNRPIEMMVMGMAFFSVLAIAAFALDGKRRARR